MDGLTAFQRFALTLTRILIGWHFLYEGLYKLLLPGWTRDGARIVSGWSAKGYLRGSTGPLAPWLRSLADSGASGWIDTLIPIALVVVGVSLMLGLFTRLGCLIAIGLLAMFYISAPPTSGMPGPNTEGAYLFVNKNLVELGAVLVLLAFPTGKIAGLDRLIALRRRREPGVPVTVQE